MKTKIKLTDEQIQQLIKVETEKLTAKYEKDLADLKKKFEFAYIDTDEEEKPSVVKKELNKEIFLAELEKFDGNLSKVAESLGYSYGYMFNKKKEWIPETVKEKKSKK